ncbi:MAG TPA: glycosyltransferase [Steroidobacteraceae bacterium]|nr:glycosyltransferase [Steroidobacteraceae bacterium]
MTRPLVSIITPTYERAWFLGEAARWIRAQSYPNYEWLILDDSREPCAALAGAADPRIRYRHVAQRMTIGAKRNALLADARGGLIAHFDDDDYYAPDYLHSMVELLESRGADFVKLSGYYLYDLRHDFFGYWALRNAAGLQFGCYANVLRVHVVGREEAAGLADNYLGYGFSYVYRTALRDSARFADANLREEPAFIEAIRSKFRIVCMDDEAGLALHLLHAQSTSTCHPQYRLPHFLLPRIFAGAGDFVGRARGAAAGARGMQVYLERPLQE